MPQILPGNPHKLPDGFQPHSFFFDRECYSETRQNVLCSLCIPYWLFLILNFQIVAFQLVQSPMNSYFNCTFCCIQYSCYFSIFCLLYTSPSPRDRTRSRMPSS